MSDLERQLEDLESTVYRAEKEVKRDTTGEESIGEESAVTKGLKLSKTTLCIIGAVIPLVIAGLLYFAKPGFVRESGKSKSRKRTSTVSTSKLVGWTVGLSLGIYLILFCLHKYGVLTTNS